MDDEATIAEDEEAIENHEAIEDGSEEPVEERKRHGPGFRLGLILGAIAGGIGATIFAPPTGEQTTSTNGSHTSYADADDASVERVRSVLDTVRSRVQEAADQAKEAAELAEQESRKRYAELTDSEPGS